MIKACMSNLCEVCLHSNSTSVGKSPAHKFCGPLLRSLFAYRDLLFVFIMLREFYVPMCHIEVRFQKWVKFNHQSNCNLLCEVWWAGLPRLDSATAALHPLLPLLLQGNDEAAPREQFCSWPSGVASSYTELKQKPLSFSLAFSLSLPYFFHISCLSLFLSPGLSCVIQQYVISLQVHTAAEKGRAYVSPPQGHLSPASYVKLRDIPLPHFSPLLSHMLNTFE